MFRYAVGAAALALTVASADPAAAQRVRAGVLTCDISAGMSFIIGSQKSVACNFAPEPPGPQQVYNGTISKFGLDVGATGGGVMVWAVFTDSIAPPNPDFSLATISARAVKSPSPPGLAPTFSSAAPTARSPCSRSRSPVRSASILPSASAT